MLIYPLNRSIRQDAVTAHPDIVAALIRGSFAVSAILFQPVVF
jgi:hypothetical protein